MNSCWIHAELNHHLHESGISMNSAKMIKIVLKRLWWMNSTWIQHEFNTILISITVQRFSKFKVKMKSAWNQHEFSMNSAWIQHRSDLKYCTKLCRIQGENEISMNSAWNQHEFNTIAKLSNPCTEFQSQRSFARHLLSIVCSYPCIFRICT